MVKASYTQELYRRLGKLGLGKTQVSQMPITYSAIKRYKPRQGADFSDDADDVKNGWYAEIKLGSDDKKITYVCMPADRQSLPARIDTKEAFLMNLLSKDLTLY